MLLSQIYCLLFNIRRMFRYHMDWRIKKENYIREKVIRVASIKQTSSNHRDVKSMVSFAYELKIWAWVSDAKWGRWLWMKRRNTSRTFRIFQWNIQQYFIIIKSNFCPDLWPRMKRGSVSSLLRRTYDENNEVKELNSLQKRPSNSALTSAFLCCPWEHFDWLSPKRTTIHA